jgi:hypothetical protein
MLPLRGRVSQIDGLIRMPWPRLVDPRPTCTETNTPSGLVTITVFVPTIGTELRSFLAENLDRYVGTVHA